MIIKLMSLIAASSCLTLNAMDGNIQAFLAWVLVLIYMVRDFMEKKEDS